MGIFSIFNPVLTLYYGLAVKIKFYWYSRKKRKRKKIASIFLKKTLSNKGIKDKTVDKIIENYLKFGETIFDRKLMQGALSLDRKLLPKPLRSKK
ncbi:MAG: hypothetical protein ACFFDS_06475 [Candidatus Thorarchaeota archaeon]